MTSSAPSLEGRRPERLGRILRGSPYGRAPQDDGEQFSAAGKMRLQGFETSLIFPAARGMMAASRQFSGGNQPDLNFFIVNQLAGHDD
jgi:hypothetical protein